MRNNVALGFGLVLAVLLASAAVLYVHIQRLSDHAGWVTHTHEVLAELEGVLALVTDAETGQRGFLLTGREPFLKPYEGAVATVPGRLDRLGELTADNPTQRANLKALRAQIDTHLVSLRKNIGLRRERGKWTEDSPDVTRLVLGKGEMDAIRVTVGRMQAVERGLLDRRADDARESALLTRLILGTVAALSVAFLGLAYYLVRRDRAWRERAADLVRREREWLEVTLLGVGDGVIATDREGRVKLLNPVAQKLTGWPQSEAVGKSVAEVFRIVNEDTRASVSNPVERCLRDGLVVGLANHTLLIARDGTERPIDDSGAPIRSGTGEILGAVLVFRDISGRRHDEREREALLTRLQAKRARLEASEAQFRRAIEDAPIPILMHAEDGEMLQVSRAFTCLTGYTRADVPTFGDWLARAYGPRADEVATSVREVFALTEGVHQAEFTVTTREGEQRVWDFSASSPGRLPDGRRFLVAMATDVTERRRAEEALRQADRRKDEFLALLGHELRNPLAPIRNGLLVLRQKGAGDPTAAQVGAMLDRQFGNLVRLVDDLLDVTRVARGKVELRKEPLELAAVAERVVEGARPFLDERGHHLEVAPAPEPLWVEADPVRLEQVLSNLLNNAAKYTAPGGHIRLAWARAGAEAVLRVRDNGIGIRPEQRGRIFEMFAQADRVSGRLSEGLGLGLTLVRNLVELHGGRVEAHSEGAGKGSEFVVYLPVLAGGPFPAPAARPDAPAAPPPAGRAPRILIVDDNVDAADSLAMLLQLEGYGEVRTAHDGPTALDVARAFVPSVVLLDIGLPRGMDGYEVARRLRELPGLEDAFLVALTGYGQQEDRRRSAEAGFQVHLVKPAEPADLRALLAQFRCP